MLAFWGEPGPGGGSCMRTECASNLHELPQLERMSVVSKQLPHSGDRVRIREPLPQGLTLCKKLPPALG